MPVLKEMEIIINDLSYKNLSNLTFTIHEGVITGITGENHFYTDLLGIVTIILFIKR